MNNSENKESNQHTPATNDPSGKLSTSWADLLKSNRNVRFPMTFYKPEESKQRGKIDMPVAITKDGSKKWENTLVGYFIDKKLPYTLVSNVVGGFWGKIGLNDILVADLGYYFFRFSSNEQKNDVLEGGPWHISRGRSLAHIRPTNHS